MSNLKAHYRFEPQTKPISYQAIMKLFSSPVATRMLITIFWGISTISIKAQIFKYKQIDNAMVRTASDSILAIEFKAAQYFHIVINDYRISKGKNPLQWSNIFWLSSRNHNLWMAENNRLDHTQNKKTSNFSGTSSKERLKYVVSESCNWSGENILYYFPVDLENSTTEVAHEIVKKSFNIWKNSSGHNKNMLANHYSQGTSFVIDTSGYVWATSNFGYCTADPKLNGHNKFQFFVNDNLDNFLPQKEPNEAVLLSENKDVSTRNTEKNNINHTNKKITTILDKHINASGIKRRNYFNKAASKHSTYIFNLGNETLVQDRNKSTFYGNNTAHRIFKASMGRSVFLRKKKEIQEFTFYKEYEPLSFDHTQIENDLVFWLKSINFSNFTVGGFGIKLGKKKKVTRLAISIILYP